MTNSEWKMEVLTTRGARVRQDTDVREHILSHSSEASGDPLHLLSRYPVSLFIHPIPLHPMSVFLHCIHIHIYIHVCVYVYVLIPTPCSSSRSTFSI
jgi:hypothetical protein